MDFDLTPPVGASPIADLSYRNYDGPLHNRAIRWWIIALSGMRLAWRKPGFWILSLLTFVPYLWAALQLLLMSTFAQGGMNPLTQGDPAQRYGRIFFGAFGGFFLFLIALLVGAGSIASDNRANALLVYLSKPISKADYLLGKWMGIFLTLTILTLAPALLLYLFCLVSFRSEGFLHDAPWLILQLLCAALVPGAIHASLLVGISAWSRSSRMAGAIYAAIYFVGGFLTMIVWAIRYHGDMAQGILVRHLSVGGVIEGLTQRIYGVTTQAFRINRNTGSPQRFDVGAPSFWPIFGIAVGLAVIGVAAARAKIRAVEVVRG